MHLKVREECKVGVGNQWVMNGALIALLCSVGVAQKSSTPGTMPLDAIIQSMQKAQAAVRPQASYQIIREYRLFGAKDSKADSEVVAEVNFRPPASEGYTIQKYSGSNRGPQLVRSVLDHEAEVTSKNNQVRSAISSDNYRFSYIGAAMLEGQPCYVLGLTPKRTDKDLISGEVWVDKHSFLVRQVQGEVEKTPSWWLKTVRIKLVFADLDGIWVQKSMEAIADVRIVGAHTLTSRILDYRREDEVAATPLPGGSMLRKR
jgi:hypothetical protein